MKRFFLILMVAIIPFALFAAGGQEETSPQAPAAAPRAMNILAPSGTPAMALSGFAADSTEVLPGYAHNIEVVTAADLVASKMIKGEADFAVIPTNLAATLYAKGVDIQMAGVVIWGNLYVVSSKADAAWEDMKGQEVYMLGRGLTPDIILQHLMTQNGIDPQSDTTLNYVGASSELAPAFLTGKSAFSIMPEPMLSVVKTKKPDTHVMLDLQEEWARLYGTAAGYPQACLVVSGKTAEEHPEYVEAFLERFDSSVSWIAENPAAAGEQAVTLMPDMAAPILTKSLPGCNLVFSSASESRSALEEYYRVLEAFNPQTIGGALPGDDFYLNR